MSQHIYKATVRGAEVTVQMGWDKPMRGFYAVVEAPEGSSQDYLYSNLDDPRLAANGGLSDSLDYIVEALSRLGIAVPAVLVKEVSSDKLNNVVNRVVKYEFEKRDKS